MRRQQIAIINSMTPARAALPEDHQRVTKESASPAAAGLQVQDVNQAPEAVHLQMEKMMRKRCRKGGMKKMMRGHAGWRFAAGLWLISYRSPQLPGI